MDKTKESKIKDLTDLMTESKRDYTILDFKYKNNASLYVLIKCKNTIHSEYWTMWHKFYTTENCGLCKQCKDEDIFSPLIIYDKIKHNFPKYKVINVHRKDNGKIYVKYYCDNPKHKLQESYLNHMINGHGCKDCAVDKLRLFRKDSELKIHEKLKQLNLEIYDWNNCNSVSSPFYCKYTDGYIYCVRMDSLKNMDAFKGSWINNSKHCKIYARENIKTYCRLNRPDYEFISGTYNGYKDKYSFRYIGEHIDEEVDSEFTCALSDFIDSEVCHPYIKMSKGERKIYKYLKMKNINFTTQQTFENCIHKKKLPFDFYLIDYNICIEYQGEQHFFPIGYWGGETEFRKITQRDLIKSKFCANNNIELISINYWHYDFIDTVMDYFLEGSDTIEYAIN